MSDKNMNSANNETAVIAGGFAALANMGTMMDFSEDLAGLDFQLDHIKLLSGGMTAFEVSSGDGENTELVKGIESMIYQENLRSIQRRGDAGHVDSGSGKTTFARCLCGLEKKAAGKVVMSSTTLNRKKRLNSYLVMQDVNHQLLRRAWRKRS